MWCSLFHDSYRAPVGYTYVARQNGKVIAVNYCVLCIKKMAREINNHSYEVTVEAA